VERTRPTTGLIATSYQMGNSWEPIFSDRAFGVWQIFLALPPLDRQPDGASGHYNLSIFYDLPPNSSTVVAIVPGEGWVGGTEGTKVGLSDVAVVMLCQYVGSVRSLDGGLCSGRGGTNGFKFPLE